MTTSGNAVASLLLGQVNAFTFDIQNQVLQERAHIAEFFVGDEWKVSDRLSLNFGTRYTLNFPSTEVNNQGAVFNLNTQVLDFPHTARDLECCDFGPRVGLAYRIGNSTVVTRSGYGMVWFEQTGITTPFTLPQFPFVQTIGLAVAGQHQCRIHACKRDRRYRLRRPIRIQGLGRACSACERDNGSGYSQQWNFTIQKTFRKRLEFRNRHTWDRRIRGWDCRMRT